MQSLAAKSRNLVSRTRPLNKTPLSSVSRPRAISHLPTKTATPIINNRYNNNNHNNNISSSNGIRLTLQKSRPLSQIPISRAIHTPSTTRQTTTSVTHKKVSPIINFSSSFSNTSLKIQSNLITSLKVAPQIFLQSQVRYGHGARRVYLQGKRKRELNKKLEKYSFEDKDLRESRLAHEREMFEKKLYVFKYMIQDIQRHSGGKKSIPIGEVMSYMLEWVKGHPERETLGDLDFFLRRQIVAATGGSNIQVRICWQEIVRWREKGVLDTKIRENEVKIRRAQEEEEEINSIRDQRERLQRQKEREQLRAEELRARQNDMDPFIKEMYMRYVAMIEMKEKEIKDLKEEEDRLTHSGKYELDPKDIEWAFRGDTEELDRFLREEINQDSEEITEQEKVTEQEGHAALEEKVKRAFDELNK